VCAFLFAAFAVFAGSCASRKATLVVAVIVEMSPALPRACCLLARIAYGSSADLTNLTAQTVHHVSSWMVLFAFAADGLPAGPTKEFQTKIGPITLQHLHSRFPRIALAAKCLSVGLFTYLPSVVYIRQQFSEDALAFEFSSLFVCSAALLHLTNPALFRVVYTRVHIVEGALA
jgi:hypothetical protein